MFDMFELSADEARREEQLLKTCRKTQGEHRPPDHSGWTTYSDDFIEAAAGLYRIYRTALENNGTRLAEFLGVPPSSRPPAVKVRPDRHDAILRHMGLRFQDTGILSCRKAQMTTQLVAYLYVYHLRRLLSSSRRSSP